MRTCPSIFIGVLILLSFTPPARAVPVIPADFSVYPHLDRIDTMPEETFAVEAFSLWGNDYFAVANEITGVNLYQVVGGEAVHLGEEQVIGSERDIAVVDWIAYVAAGSQGLSRMSVAVPESPIRLDSVVLPGEATRVAVSATHAYVACGTGGLVVVDITNSGTMYNVGSYGLDVTAVCLDGNRLGIINNGQFEILDITTPAAPALLGTYAPGLGGNYIDLALQGNLAYVMNPGQVERLDVTAPGAIFATDVMNLNGPYNLYRGRLEMEGTELLVAASNYLGIIDFSTGTVLRETRQVGILKDAAIIGGKILAVTDERLEIYQDELHANPAQAGSLQFSSLMSIKGIMQEDVLWGLADPIQPAGLVAAEIGGSGGLLWSLDLDLPGEYVYGLAQRGNAIAVITNTGVLRLASVSRYGATLRGSVALADIYLPQSSRVLAFLDDETLVIMDTGAGELTYNIRVVDIADPDNPTQIGLYPLTMGYASQVLTEGSLVFAARHNGVEVFDASNRLSLQYLTVHDLGNTSNRIYVKGSWMYSIHSGSTASLYGDENLQTRDISDILNPVVTDQLDLPRAGHLVFAGDWAYQQYSGLILDFSDPAHPAPAGNFSLPSPSVSQHLDVVASREYIVTDTDNNPGGFVHYMPAHLGTGEISAVEDDIPAVEPGLSLQAVPNPFNPRVTFQFEMAVASHARLGVFDLRGRLVADLGEKYRQAGPNSVTWDGVDRMGRNLPSGVYLARISTPNGSASRKIVLAR